MIIVTGANGKLGRAVVERLLDTVPAEELGVSVRDPEKAEALSKRGVRVRQGDFSDAVSLTRAFEKASQVLIISSSSMGESAVDQHRRAINIAKNIGIERILYTSHMGASPTSHFPPMVDHAATEEALRYSGVAFTSLRNGFYASSALMILGDALKTGELAAPEDGPVAWTTHADLAEATVIALTGDSLAGVSPGLTGSQAIDFAGIAALASELGCPIRRIVVPDDEYRDGLVTQGFPEPMANMFIGLFQASRQGDFARVEPTLERLLGRPPTSMRDVLKAVISSTS